MVIVLAKISLPKSLSKSEFKIEYSTFGHLNMPPNLAYKSQLFLIEMFEICLKKYNDQCPSKTLQGLKIYSKMFIKPGNYWVSRSAELKLHKTWLPTMQSFVTLVHFCGKSGNRDVHFQPTSLLLCIAMNKSIHERIIHGTQGPPSNGKNKCFYQAHL